jgi:itaconate CoA-transferase
MLGLQNEREWAAFCEKVLRQPELQSDERFSANYRRTANRQPLRDIIVETFAQLTVEQILERLEDAQIANAKVNDMHGVWAHPQLHARHRWVEVDSPRGKLPALLPPATNNAFNARMDPIPALGEHSQAILAELGFTSQAIEQLKQAGTL